MNISSICNIVLDETSTAVELRDALNAFTQICSDVSGIQPAPGFDAWAADSLLDNGVAINPQAAAHCVQDYQRSVAFIRGVHAAITTLKTQHPETPLEILYAGCGPFATLLLPLLGLFSPGELKICLLDIHQSSLDSVELLLSHFGYSAHKARTLKGNACHYKHPEKLDLIIAETMQKSLEQEPQFSVTANLAPQLLTTGVFVPQRIEVVLCLADLEYEKELVGRSDQIDPKALEMAVTRYPIATVCTLTPEDAAFQMSVAQKNADATKLELEPTVVVIPAVAESARFDAGLFTRIHIFGRHHLGDYESQITLPLRCTEIDSVSGGERYRVSYQLGSYPRFNLERLNED
jgi:hypothetical protein